MDFTELSKEEIDAIESPPENNLPTKGMLLRQIESDFVHARKNKDQDAMQELEDRHKRVKDAANRITANRAYAQ